MKKIHPVVILLAVCMAGCYHATIDTGLQPNGQTVENKWASGFLAGLVPPKTVETVSKCPNGVAKVETQMSFVNQLANVLTAGIYTPMTITVQCAGARTGGTAPAPMERNVDESRDEFVTKAVIESLKTGQPIYLQMN